MPYKDPEKQKQASRAHYERNRDEILARSVQHKRVFKQGNREYVRGLKDGQKCNDCGKTFPHYVLDFDHLRDKTASINYLVNNASRQRLEEEIAKCELVCANCHRVRTWSRLATVTQSEE